MRRKTISTTVGTGLSRAAEWIHYVTASWLVFERGGTRAVGAYLVAVALPGSLVRRFRPGGLVAPLAVVMLALSPATMEAWQLIALGLAVGLGSAWAGRPVAWMAGVQGTSGMMGIAGAVAGLIFVASGAVLSGLLTAAALMAVSFAFGESHETRTARPSVVQPATVALAFVVGMRIVETGLFQRPAAAGLFAVAWAIGVEAGWRTAPRTDARIVLGTPFLIAAALAVLGVVQGPSMLFLYGGIGFGIGVVGGSGLPQQDRGLPGRSTRYVLAAMAGAVWAASSNDFSTTVWVASAVALGGGFISSQLARRLPVPVPETQAPVPVPVSTEPAAEAPPELAPAELVPAELVPAEARVTELATEVPAPERDTLEDALGELADAIARARVIRREAIATLAAAMSTGSGTRERTARETLDETKARTQNVLDELSQDLVRALARLQRAAA